MAEGPVFDAGELRFFLGLDMPREDREKLDVLQGQEQKLGGLFDKFGKVGAAAIASAAGAAAFFLSGQGFRQLFGLLGDIFGLVSDLLFVKLLPFIRPLLDKLPQFINDLVGFFESRTLGEVFRDAFNLVIPKLVQGGVALASGFAEWSLSDAGKSTYRSIGKTIAGGIWDGIKGLGGAIGGALTDVDTPEFQGMRLAQGLGQAAVGGGLAIGGGLLIAGTGGLGTAAGAAGIATGAGMIYQGGQTTVTEIRNIGWVP